MNNKIKGGIIAIVIILLGLLLFKIFEGMEKEPARPKVFKTIKYVKTDTYGKLKSNSKIEVYSEVSGIVVKNNPAFKVGNSFTTGKIIIKVDDEETRLSLYSQKSDFLNLLTRMMADIKSDFPDSYRKWNKYLEDFEIESNIEELPEPNSSKEKYFLAGRNIYKLYYGIKNLEVRLSKYNIRAPFSGVVTQSMIEAGTSIRPGQKLGEFAGMNNFELELPFDENEVNFINIGSEVKVYNENNTKIRYGKVIRISDHIDAATQTISVFVSVSGTGLFDGMYMRGVIKGKKIKNTFKIPRKALVNNDFIHSVGGDSLLSLERINVIYLSENEAYISGIDSIKTVVIEPLVNTPVGTKIIQLRD